MLKGSLMVSDIKQQQHLKEQQSQRKLSTPRRRFWRVDFWIDLMAFVVTLFLGIVGVFVAVWLLLFFYSRI